MGEKGAVGVGGGVDAAAVSFGAQPGGVAKTGDGDIAIREVGRKVL